MTQIMIVILTAFLAHQISARIVYEIVPRMNYSESLFPNPSHGVPISKFRLFWGRLVASGASLQRLRPSWYFLEALGRFFFFSGVRLVIDRGHIVFDAIFSIVAQTLCIGPRFYMGEACSDVSKNLSYRIAIQS